MNEATLNEIRKDLQGLLKLCQEKDRYVYLIIDGLMYRSQDFNIGKNKVAGKFFVKNTTFLMSIPFCNIGSYGVVYVVDKDSE